MSSTFALPSTFFTGGRRGRLRRGSDDAGSAHDAGTASVTRLTPTEHTPVVVATEPGTIEPGLDVAALPFLRTPASWQLTGTRPVSYLDHVAVTPSGVLAITTRFHLAAEGEEQVARAWQDIRRAKGAAKLLEITLGEGRAHVEDDDERAAVHAVLVIWGPGAPSLENGYLLVKGVYVLDPSRPAAWAHLFDDAVLDEAARAALAATLHSLQVSSHDVPIACAG